MKIILDAMGGDNAPEAVVLGALDAAKDFQTEIILVGRGEDILAAMKKNGVNDLPAGVAIAHADDVVDMHDDPAAVLHKRKNSSMVVGLKMLAEGQGDAFVSAGSTGALLTAATLVLVAAILTGFGVFDRIAKFAGAGTLVPITGFANSVVSTAIDAKSEGLILGVGAKVFSVAGPVLLYGTLAGTAYGVIYWITTLF